MNALIGEKLSITNPKAQTTRHRIMGIWNDLNHQIVFSDTPGILDPVYKLQENMMTAVNDSIKDADLLLYLVEIGEPVNAALVDQLKTVKCPIIIVLNKVDLNNQEEVETRVGFWAETLPESEILPVSALHQFNTKELVQLMTRHLPEHPPYYDKDELTDRSVRFFVSEIIREKILVHYKKEIPYSVEVVVEDYTEEERMDRIQATIFVERESQKMILIGQGGRAIKRMGTDARRHIENFIKKKVYLDLTVKVRKDWRSNDRDLKEFGYLQIMSNIVAIVGRPNVGKSTLFNRLIGERQAIVDEQSGVTRDRTYGKSTWNGVEFNLIDSGGYVKGSEDAFEGEIRKQVDIAISEASVILFVVDVAAGIMGPDEVVAQVLRKARKPIMVVVNKVDNGERIADATEFYALGLGDYFCISSINGSGTGELLDHLVTLLSPDPEEEVAELPRFAIVGRPNVGKSSLTNALLGTNRNIVTDIAGTTRDTIDSHYSGYGFEFTLVDTAGIRKKKSVHEDVEFYSVLRSIRAIEGCDVCILMIDATQGFEHQDMTILGLAQKNHKGIVILVNKWDLVEKDTMSTKEYTERIHAKMAPFNDVPVLFVSALTKQRIHKALEKAVDVYKNRTTRIPTKKLNDLMLPIMERTPPPSVKHHYIKIKYVTQLPTHFPSFAFFCNHPQHVREDYRRFLENKLREAYDFNGVPIEIYMRKK